MRLDYDSPTLGITCPRCASDQWSYCVHMENMEVQYGWFVCGACDKEWGRLPELALDPGK